jgi:hypothetical protein
MALTETKPAFRSWRIVGPKASARTSAMRLRVSPLLVPSCPGVSWSRRLSILVTEVRCHLPPAAPDIPLRFNSFARTRRETKPAAISFRMVGSIARARASAARFPPNTPCIPCLPGEVSLLSRSIGRLWPRLARRRPMLRLCRGPHLFGQHHCKASVALYRISHFNLGPSIHRCDSCDSSAAGEFETSPTGLCLAPPAWHSSGVVKLSPYRLITNRRGSPGLPFGWEIHDAADAEISRSPATFRSRHEAMAEGEKAMQTLTDTAGGKPEREVPEPDRLGG